MDKSVILNLVGVFIDSVLMQVIPVVALCILMVLILIKLKEVKKRRETLKKDTDSANADQTGSALLAIVILFLICEMPIACLSMASMIDIDIYKNVVTRVILLALVFRLLNSSLNLILYCAMSKQFRIEFRNTFPHIVEIKAWIKGSQEIKRWRMSDSGIQSSIV